MFNNDIFFSFIFSCCIYYNPSKVNKKQIKQLFYTFPFFLSNIKDQNIFFETIVKYPITSYYDSSKNMIHYSYIIYRDYHKKIKKNYLNEIEYISYYNKLIYENKDYNYKTKINNFLFLLVIIICFYFIYAY
tara:strand:- start:419 stop:814 length:396 start_codon:yes stop_codon:yes gene_type:complete